MSSVKIIGAHIAAARALLRITQAELASAAGLTEEAINKFENGRTVPRPSTITALRTALENRGIIFTNGDRPGVTLDRSKAVIPS